MFDEFVLTDPLVGALSGGGNADRITGELVSGNYFHVLGVVPRVGRLLQPADDQDSGTSTPAVISERLWRRWFAASPDAIGQPVKMAEYPLVIVGVAPDAFKGTWLPTVLAADVWVPLRATAYVRTIQGSAVRTSHRTLGTLRPGISLTQANVAVETLGSQLPPGQRDRAGAPSSRLAVLPGRSGIMIQEFEQYGVLLGSAILGLSGLVFLIACANVATLLLARGANRAGEMAIRMAIGADRRRIFQLQLTETMLITMAAGLVGLALTSVTTWAMASIPLPSLEGITIRFDPSPDLHVFAYAFIVAALAVMVVGLVPARQAASTEPWRALASGGSGGGATVRGRRLRTWLVGSQVSMSVFLLIAAGLYLRSAFAALSFDPGYDMSKAAMASIDLRLHNVDDARGRRIITGMLEAARVIPGAQGAALASAVPAAGPTWSSSFRPDEPSGSRDIEAFALGSYVSSGFFATLGIPIRRGRDFSDRDGPGAPAVVILSERLASKLWPGQDAIGRRVIAASAGGSLEVVGVAADTATSLRARSPYFSYFYRPAAQEYSPKMSVIVRTTGNPAAVLDLLRKTLRGVDPDVAVFDVRTVADSVGLMLVPIRLTAMVLGSLGVLGLGIATLGVYGIMAMFVSQRAREFGVRKALGASGRQIHGMVLRQALIVLVRGAIPGLVCALIGAGFLRALLYGVQPRDPVTFVAVPLVLVAAGLAASYLPSRRAARVDPSVALRDF